MSEHQLRVELERRHLTLGDIVIACGRSKPEDVAGRLLVPVAYVEGWLKLAEQEGSSESGEASADPPKMAPTEGGDH